MEITNKTFSETLDNIDKNLKVTIHVTPPNRPPSDTGGVKLPSTPAGDDVRDKLFVKAAQPVTNRAEQILYRLNRVDSVF